MSIAEVRTHSFTPGDLLRMPNGKDYELVDGELVERRMGWNSSWIGGNLFALLVNHSGKRGLGLVAPADASYQCFSDDPDKVRKPDISFIAVDRLPPEEEREGHCRVVPDLVGEVVSPNDLYSEVAEKVNEYLDAGVRLVWVLNPGTRSVRIHRLNGTVADLDEADELSGEDVIPDFRCLVADLFEIVPRSA